MLFSRATALLAVALPLAVVSVPTAATADEPVGYGVAAGQPSYWTPARMGKARPARKLNAGRLPALKGASRPTAAAKTVAPLRVRGSGQPRSVGRVFFTHKNVDYTCSASVVNSGGRNLLATAAHCVFDQGVWAKNWVFVPGYSYRSGKHQSPYGIWTAKSFYIESEWKRADLDYDYAFVRVAPLRGRNIASVVGAQGLKWNQPAKVSMRMFGYPAEGSWNGSKVVSCSDTTWLESAPSDGISRHRFSDCRLNGGSSGGPWVSGYSTTYGVGYLIGVQSLKWWNAQGVTMWNSSAYLGDRAYSLYRKAAG